MPRKTRKLPPGRYSLIDKPIRCPHCDGDQFTASEAQLNTALMTLIELDWIDRTATILTCSTCGRIQWFALEPVRQS